MAGKTQQGQSQQDQNHDHVDDNEDSDDGLVIPRSVEFKEIKKHYIVNGSRVPQTTENGQLSIDKKKANDDRAERS